MPVGYSFPFQVSSGSVGYFQMTTTELDAIKSNLKVLLLTNKGERPMRWDFGCNLREFLFEQAHSEDLGSRVADRIIQQIGRWMPFITLTELNVLFADDDSSIPQNAMLVRMAFKLTSRPDVNQTFSQLVF